MAAQYQTRPTSSASSTSSSRPLSTHPQLRLPLSHHGLPRAPTSPKSSFSSRSHRYEPLSKDHRRHHSTSDTPIRTTTIHADRHSYSPDADDEDDDDYDDDDAYSSSSPSSPSTPGARGSSRTTSHFFRLSTAPPSPPMTPFSPSAFPSSSASPSSFEAAHDKSDADVDAFAQQHCPRCRCSLEQVRPSAPPIITTTPAATVSAAAAQQRARARSMDDEVPSPVRRQASTWSVGGRNEEVEDGAVQQHVSTPLPSSSSLAKFGKKIKAKLGSGGGGDEGRRERESKRASRRVEYEEMEEVHWTEI